MNMDTEIINNDNFIIGKIKQIPKKYYIIGGVTVLILIAMYISYRFGKNDAKKCNMKNNLLPKNVNQNNIPEKEHEIINEDVELPEENAVIQQFIDNEISALDAANALRISRKTFYRRVKKFKDARDTKVDE